MSTNPSLLFEFVGIVLPISFIGLRILLDEIEETGSIQKEAKANAYIRHAIAMVAFLVAAGWLAILELLFPELGYPFAALGYVSAATGITIPVWLLWALRSEFLVEDVAETA